METLWSRTQPNPPWPEADNSMVGYLVGARARKVHDDEGIETALLEVVVHAWFGSKDRCHGPA